jgi:hypothetical protein
MALPKAALEARRAAERMQGRRNMLGGALAASFVVGVFYYCLSAVGDQRDAITEGELAQFRKQRERQRQMDAMKNRT